jgi:hypothetical protein
MKRPKIVDAIESNLSMFSSEDANFVITRPDGLVVWENLDDKKRLQEMGALGCGLWQSAKTFGKFTNNNSLNPTLSFGSSADGLFVSHVKIKSYEYILFVIYKGCLNPAKLKLKFRSFRQVVEDFLFYESEQNEKEEQIFSDITDKEVDDLFSFTEV